MSTQKKMAIRMAAYSALVGYLLLDLFVFNGPIKMRLSGPDADSPEAIAAAKAQGVVARVYGQPVYRQQVDERVKRYLLERGRNQDQVSEAEKKMIQQVVLRDLIDERLVKVQIKVSPKESYAVSEAEVDQAVDFFKKRYEDEIALAEAMKRQGWAGEKELRFRVAGRLQQERFFEAEIGKEVKIDDATVREWFEENQDKLHLPERREIRHIFVAALDHEASEGAELIETARKRIVEAKEDFAKVAGEMSEDLRSKSQGGSLGWVTKNRLPADFGTPVFALELNQISLIQSKLGWHLVEVTALEKARPQAFEEVAEEIRAALEIRLKDEKIEGFRRLLRHWAGAKVEVFHDVLHAESAPKTRASR